jgi:uroporphyrinogen decarboxylase
MASKNGSLISPMTFRKFLTPQYRRVAEFARGHGIDILLVDSDGFMEELSGWMTEAGATAVYPFEVGAGNDLARVRERYPNLGMIGGLEKNAMALGPKAVAKEMEKARAMIRRGRFIPGPDHFALSNVSFEQYRYFMEQLKDVVMTTRPGAES